MAITHKITSNDEWLREYGLLDIAVPPPPTFEKAMLRAKTALMRAKAFHTDDVPVQLDIEDLDVILKTITLMERDLIEREYCVERSNT